MNGNEPAMPSTPLLHRVDTPTGLKEVSMFGHLGLTKRELFAAMFLHAFLSRRDYTRYADAAHDAVKHTDALIAALGETVE